MVAYLEHKDLANSSISAVRAREIADGVHRVFDRLARAEAAAGRLPGSVQLLAATKTRDVGEVLAAVDAGVRCIGENRPQELVAKFQAGLPALCEQRGLRLGCWPAVEPAEGSAEGSAGGPALDSCSSVGVHLIGQLQSNKVNKVVGCVDTVESVDSLDLARRLSRRAVLSGRPVGVFLEVNVSGELSKSGCAPDEALDLALELASLPALVLRGVMTVGAHVVDERRVRSGFAWLRQLRDDVLSSGQAGSASCVQLSMGMSGDLEFAVAEGSTLVRVGSAIFGERAFL